MGLSEVCESGIKEREVWEIMYDGVAESGVKGTKIFGIRNCVTILGVQRQLETVDKSTRSTMLS